MTNQSKNVEKKPQTTEEKNAEKKPQTKPQIEKRKIEKKSTKVIEKNKKRHFKQQILFLATTILSLIAITVSVNVTYGAKKNELYNQNVVLNSSKTTGDIKTTFKVPGLSKQQIEDLGKRDDVSSYLPYYMSQNEARVNGKLILGQVFYFINDTEHMALTAFGDSRILKSSNQKEGAYVDYQFAKTFNVSLGDVISYPFKGKYVDIQVTHIGLLNYVDGVTNVLVVMNDKIKQIMKDAYYNGNDIKYNGTYVACSNKESFDSYLKTYKPEGQLLQREDFSSDGEYYAYLYSIKDVDYYKNVTDVSKIKDSYYEASKQAEIKLSAIQKNLLIINAIVAFVAVVIKMIVDFLVFSKSDSTKTNYVTIQHLIQTALLVVVALLTGFICDKQMVIALGAIPAAVLLVGGLLEFFLLKKAVKNKSRK
mgnify:CR=1 FL=1